MDLTILDSHNLPIQSIFMRLPYYQKCDVTSPK